VQGKYEEAEPLYRRALAVREKQLGAEHPDTALSLNNLAGLYHVQGKYEEAEPLYKRALTVYEQRLGAEHPNTQTIRRNYVALLRAMGCDGK
jgi:tetratricopeptide (TPR) repeat protein